MRNFKVHHICHSLSETPRQPPATHGFYTCSKLLKCIYFTNYDLFKLQTAGPHVSAIIFIIGLLLESVELACCVDFFRVFIS